MFCRYVYHGLTALKKTEHHVHMPMHIVTLQAITTSGIDRGQPIGENCKFTTHFQETCVDVLGTDQSWKVTKHLLRYLIMT